MIACRCTVPETCAVFAIAGYTGVTWRIKFAAATLPPTFKGLLDLGGGGGARFEPAEPPITPPSTPSAEPPATPPTTPAELPTSGGCSSSLMILTFFGITVGVVSWPL